MKKTILSLMAATAVMSATAQGFPPIKLPEVGWRNIDYVGDGLEGHKLDVFLPDSLGGPYKPVVIIYGSAWFANNAKDMATASIAKPLLDAGFAVVSINHRGSPEAKFPAQINDVKAAIRYIRANADKYQLDPSWVGITGFSSGGHLSSLAGATNGVKDYTVGKVTMNIEGDLGNYTGYSSDVNAVVDWFGPIDMTTMDEKNGYKGADSPESVLIGAPAYEHPEVVALMDPKTYLDPKDPKFIVIHGNADNVVPYSQSVAFQKALANQGLLEKFITVQDGGHGPLTFNDYTFEEMARFFSRESGGSRVHTYKGNPIIRNKFTADPAPMVYNDRLYLYVGHDEYYDGQDTAGGGKEFNITEWLCYSTDDIQHWTDHGAVLAPTDFSWAKEAAWAAQVVEKDGKFYYYTTSIGNDDYPGYCVGVAVSDSPTGPFRDARGTPLVTDKMTDNGTRGWWNDIDPTVLVDGDDAWLCWGNGTCFMAKLKPNMTEIDGEIWVVDVPNYVEGPWLHRRGDIYYLTYASIDGRQEAIDYATATSPRGPWTYRGQLTGNAKNSFTIHPGIANFKGKDYLFYHNATLEIDGHKGAIGRRAVCVDELNYNPDGTMQKVIQK